MTPNLTARAILFFILLAPGAFAYEHHATLAHEPVEMAEVHAVSPGTPVKGECEDGDACVAIPVAVSGTDSTGEKQTVVTTYKLGPELVDQVRSDFQGVASAVLRNLREPIRTGLGSSDSEVKSICRGALWQVDGNVHYKVADGVKMPLKIEATVSKIADKTFEQSGHPIVVTSGTRSPLAQADAMRTKISLGDNLLRLYANKKAVGSVLHAYREAKHMGLDAGGVNTHMAKVIQAQVDKGVYLSDHLRDGAVDIRTKDLSPTVRHELMAAVYGTEGVHKSIQESIPPHLHLELN